MQPRLNFYARCNRLVQKRKNLGGLPALPLVDFYVKLAMEGVENGNFRNYRSLANWLASRNVERNL